MLCLIGWSGNEQGVDLLPASNGGWEEQAGEAGDEVPCHLADAPKTPTEELPVYSVPGSLHGSLRRTGSSPKLIELKSDDGWGVR